MAKTTRWIWHSVRQFKARQLNSLCSDLFVTQHITADQLVINVSPTPRHNDNETLPLCPGVSRSQISLVKHALLLVCALLTVTRKACNTCKDYEMFPSPSCTAARTSHHSCCTACTALSTFYTSCQTTGNTLGIPESLWPWSGLYQSA